MATNAGGNDMNMVMVFEAMRTAYGMGDVDHPMTVGELRAMLDDLDEDMPVILSHDGGYTYGSLSHYPTFYKAQEGEYGTEYVETDDVWCC